MKIGISSLCLFKEPFEKLIKSMRKTESVKIWELVDDGLHKLNLVRVKKLKELGLKYTVHGPFADVNTAAFSNNLRRVFKRIYERSLNYAYRLSSEVWVLHAGIRTGLNFFFPEDIWSKNREFIKFLADRAEDYGIMIAIENLINGGLIRTASEVIRLLREINSQNLAICLDIGHLNVINRGKIINDVKRLIDNVIELHVHDNDGKTDQHLRVGSGGVRWEKIFEYLRRRDYNGYIIIENYSLSDSLASLKEVLRLTG